MPRRVTAQERREKRRYPVQERTVDEILCRIDNMIAPGHMSTSEALDTIIQLRDHLDSRAAGLGDDLKTQQEEND